MDGENIGTPYEQMDDLGVPVFLETPIYHKDQRFIHGSVNILQTSPMDPSWVPRMKYTRFTKYMIES